MKRIASSEGDPPSLKDSVEGRYAVTRNFDMDAMSIAARPVPSPIAAPTDFLRRRALALALASLLVIALGLRLYGINWDAGSDFSLHPDERSIVWTAQQLSPSSFKHPLELFDVDSSSLVPRRPTHTSGHGVYDYGSLPFYTLGLGAWLVSLLPGIDKPDMYSMTLWGRGISALLDTGTVLVVFLIGRRLFGPRAGLLAALFTTFAVIHIQLSHFYTTEVMLTFFGVLAFYFLIGVAREGRKRDAALAGIAFGLAMASKFSAAPMLVGMVAAPALYALRWDGDRVKGWEVNRERLRPALKALGVMFGLMAVTFVVTQPYAILDIKHYAADFYNQSQMVRRVVDFPYTRQYDNSLPFLYHIWQFSVWGVGLPLGVLMWAGMGLSAAIALTRRRRADLLLMAWVLPFFLITGLAEVKFLRYMLPITPFMAIMAARLSASGQSWLRGRRLIRPSLPHRAGAIALGLVVVATVFYAFAFANVYTDTHPAVQVSTYVKSNLPRSTVLAVEHWDESLPGLYAYPRATLQLYDSDGGQVFYKDYRGRDMSGTKAEHLAHQLASSDYLVLFSNRLYGSIPRMRERYPLSSRYYQILFDGDLGFEVAYVGQAYPNFLGVSFVNDTFSRPGLRPPPALASIEPTPLTLHLGYADDSFVNYDHPMTILFKNVARLSEGQLIGLLEGGRRTHRRGGIMASPLLDRGKGALLSDEATRRQQEGGTFSDLFDRNSFSNKAPWLVWFVAVELIALVALPAGLMLFRRLPDRGYLLIKVLGLLLVGYLTWLLASLHWLPFSRGTLWLAILLVGAVSAVALARRRGEIVGFLRRRWRFILFCEALFLVAFLAFCGIRAWNPDLWHPSRGGEKPMDFAYLNAVVKSTDMPPYDPWFAGGYLNYYYFGQFQIASLIKLTGILPSVAYNLAIPLLFALTIGGAFSIVYNLTAQRGGGGRGPPAKGRASIIAGLTGAVFVAVFGNLDGLVQLVQGVWRVTFQGLPFGGIEFWRSSRMIDTSISPTNCGGCEITEFPFFSFLFADLHAHLIALPFALLAIGIGLSLVLGARRGPGRWMWWAGLGALALTVGALFTINSWDYPTFLLLGAAVVLLAVYLGHPRLSPAVLVKGGVAAGALLVLSLLLFLPFHLNYNGSVDFPFIKRSGFSTPLYQYLGIHGIFVFIVLSYLLYRLHQAYGLFSWARFWGGSGVTGSAGRLQYLRGATGLRVLYLTSSATLLIVVAVVGLHTVAFLLLILLLMAPLALRHLHSRSEQAPMELFAFALLGLALALGIGVDLFKVNLVDPGRMNTVFKFYFHAWTLMALASAYFLSRLEFGRLLPGRWKGRGTWMAALGVLLASGMIYPIAATPDRAEVRFNPSPPTIDGMAYMKEATYYDDHDDSGSYEESERLDLKWDYDAILWIQDNVPGSPVILEGNTAFYRWGNRVSIYTGLPTIIGWEWHQRQQRWDFQDDVFARRADVKALYSDTSIPLTVGLLQKYRVKYIYVGQLERLYYPEAGIRKFEQMAASGLLDIVYPVAPETNSEVVIYRVVR